MIVCVLQAYNVGKKNKFESDPDPGVRGVMKLEVECLKGYGTWTSLGTTVLED
jgi:hypothetical protein